MLKIISVKNVVQATVTNTNKLFLSNAQNRLIHLTLANNLKKIEKKVDEAKKTIVIEGKYLDEKEFPHNGPVLQLSQPQENEKKLFSDDKVVTSCSFCELEKRGIFVQYTDVLVLKQFLTDDGEVLPKKITGLCKRSQIKLYALVKLAKQAGLILNLQPRLLDGSKPSSDPSSRQQHLKYNSYFDKYEIMKKKQKFI